MRFDFNAGVLWFFGVVVWGGGSGVDIGKGESEGQGEKEGASSERKRLGSPFGMKLSLHFFCFFFFLLSFPILSPRSGSLSPPPKVVPLFLTPEHGRRAKQGWDTGGKATDIRLVCHIISYIGLS